MLAKSYTHQEELEIAPLGSKNISIKKLDGKYNRILFLGYSTLPVGYRFKLYTDETLKEGVSIPHNTLPFLLQHKGNFLDSSINLFFENLDETRSFKFNILVSFFEDKNASK